MRGRTQNSQAVGTCIPLAREALTTGPAWLAAKTSALLVVPSVVVPPEDNILINPLHPDAKGIKATNTGQWQFDHRLFPS